MCAELLRCPLAQRRGGTGEEDVTFTIGTDMSSRALTHVCCQS